MGRASFVLAAGIALVACSTVGVACSSLPDLRFDAAEGGAEGGVETGPSGPCVPSGDEICDDGIDNDCNGRTDCQDNRCNAGFRCTDVPAGWTTVSFAGATTPSCPERTTGTDLQVAAGDGSAGCACTCTGAGGSCATGNFTLNLSNEPTCGVGATTGTVPRSGNCNALGASFNVQSYARIAQAVGPTSCAPSPSESGALARGRVCQAARFGGGCDANEVCAPRTSTGFETCITKAGKNACPPGFSKRSTVGASATDTRTCTGCTCGAPTACVGGSVSLYGNSMCKTNGGNDGAENIDGACDGLIPDQAFTATHFKATPPSGGCGMPTSPGTGAGTLTFVDERTVCCD